MSEGKIAIINVMEEIVDIKADEVINSTEMCHCPRCRADVKALALNNLPTKYVASEGGNVFMHMQTTTTQMQAEIMVAIVEAVSKVRYKPSHPLEKVGNLKKVKEKRFSVYGKGSGEADAMATAPAAAAEEPGEQKAAAKISPEDIAGGAEKPPSGKISEEDIGGASKEAAMAAALAAAKAKAGDGAEAAAQDKEAAMAAALAAAKAKAEMQPTEPEDEGLADSTGYGAFDATKMSEM